MNREMLLGKISYFSYIPVEFITQHFEETDTKTLKELYILYALFDKHHVSLFALVDLGPSAL